MCCISRTCSLLLTVPLHWWIHADHFIDVPSSLFPSPFCVRPPPDPSAGDGRSKKNATTGTLETEFRCRLNRLKGPTTLHFHTKKVHINYKK